MSKYEMIDRIRQFNRSVAETFLMEFEESQLESYLQRLTKLSGHRGRDTVWVRPVQSNAVATRRLATVQ